MIYGKKIVQKIVKNCTKIVLKKIKKNCLWKNCTFMEKKICKKLYKKKDLWKKNEIKKQQNN